MLKIPFEISKLCMPAYSEQKLNTGGKMRVDIKLTTSNVEDFVLSV